MEQQTQTNMSIRVSKTDKKDFENFCSDVGINVSVAVNMFIKKVLIDRKIPFEISQKTQFSKDLQEALLEAEEMRKHPGNYKGYTSVKELLEDLDNEQ